MEHVDREVECRIERHDGGLACGRCEDCCEAFTSRAVQAEARVAELESQLEAVTEELGKVQLAYEMSEALRLKPDQSGEGGK